MSLTDSHALLFLSMDLHVFHQNQELQKNKISSCIESHSSVHVELVSCFQFWWTQGVVPEEQTLFRA
jgi:hypothetical protein